MVRDLFDEFVKDISKLVAPTSHIFGLCVEAV